MDRMGSEVLRGASTSARQHSPRASLPSLTVPEDSLAAVPENASDDAPGKASAHSSASKSAPLSSFPKRGLLRSESTSPRKSPSTTDESERALRRPGSQPVSLFGNSTDEDEENDLAPFPRSMSEEAGKIWKSLGEFSALKEIYRGRVSLVASATCKKSHRSVVLKAYIKGRLSKSLREMVYREIRLHGQVRFLDGVTEILGWFEDDLQIVLVLEHCTGGDVYRRLVLEGGQMTEPSAATDVLNPLVKAMVGVHRKRLSHRDLKPENLFYCITPKGDRKLKVGDFGLTSDLQEMRDRVGTLDYMAPEILLQQDETAFSMQVFGGQAEGGAKEGSGSMPKVADGPYTSKVDVWAVGIIAYELLTGRPPFEVNSPHQTAMLIVWGSPEFPPHVSPSARDFILAALQKDPEERPTMAELLQHPFLMTHAKLPLFSNSKRSQFLKARPSFVMPKPHDGLVSNDGDEGVTVESSLSSTSGAQKRRTDVAQVQQANRRIRRGLTTRDISLATHGASGDRDAHLKAKVKLFKPRTKPRGQNSFHAPASTHRSSSSPKSTNLKPGAAKPWSHGPSRLSDDSCYSDMDGAATSNKISNKPSAAPAAATTTRKVRKSDHSAASGVSSTVQSSVQHYSAAVPRRISTHSAPSPPRSILRRPSDTDAAAHGAAADTNPSLRMNPLAGMRTMSLTGEEGGGTGGAGGDSWDRKATLFSRFFSSLLCGRSSIDGEMCGSGAKPMERNLSESSTGGGLFGHGGYGTLGRRSRSRRESRRDSATSGSLSNARTSDGTTGSMTLSMEELQLDPPQSSETNEASRAPVGASGSSSQRPRRNVKKSASRIGMGLSRLLSRIGLDDGDSSSFPWNTNGVHLVKMTPQLRNAPDLDTLEAMKANAKSSTRNRMKEYMVRRGGDNETTRQSLAHENMPSALGAAEASTSGANDAAQASFPDTTAEVAASVPVHRLRQSERSGA